MGDSFQSACVQVQRRTIAPTIGWKRHMLQLNWKQIYFGLATLSTLFLLESLLPVQLF